jgi:Mn-dependent DtxR family transcriptional regulator
VESKPLAPIDLEQLRVDMAATIEKAKENDPDELKNRIKELERQVKKGAPAVVPAPVTVRDEDAIRRAVATAATEFDRIQTQFATALTEDLQRLEDTAIVLGETIGHIRRVAATMREPHVSVRALPPATAPTAKTAMARGDTKTLAEVEHARLPEMKSGTTGNQSAEQRILNAMGALEQLGFRTPKKSNVAFFAGYVENWRFDGRVADLREKGLIEVVGPGEIALTSAGRALADASQSIRSLGELHATWLSKLPQAESDALRILLREYPVNVHRHRLAREMERQDNWRFSAIVNQLKALGIVELDGSGDISLTNALFPEGLS